MKTDVVTMNRNEQMFWKGVSLRPYGVESTIEAAHRKIKTQNLG